MAKKSEKAPQKEIKEASGESEPSTKPTELPIQPVMNIGLVGHVDHGKTTLTERLSGKWTDTHSEEIKRGITIRLGYADTVLVKTKDGQYMTEHAAQKDKKEYTVLRKISLVDAPGHESLMATMLAGSTIMDGALLLVSAAESCPQPQTREHIMALQITGVKNVIIIQNKIDLVTYEEAVANHAQIRAFLKGTAYENAPIIPISARSGANIDMLLEAINEHIPTPKRDPNTDPFMLVARSFDVNKPGTKIEEMQGGVLGGTLIRGLFRTNDEIEISPGRMTIVKNKPEWTPLKTTIKSLKSGGNTVNVLGPGGSIGVLTQLDPAVVKSDSLAGSIAGKPGKLPPVWYECTLKTSLLKRVVGIENEMDVKPIIKSELLMLNVNAAATVGVVTELKKNTVHCMLKKPICAEKGARVTKIGRAHV